MASEEQTKRLLSAGQTAELLRALAAELDQGRLGAAVLADQALLELKQALKEKDGKTSLELKLKYRGPAAQAAPTSAGPAPRGYKSLKKAMAKSWGQLEKTLAQGQTPPPELTRLFAEQSRRMVGFAGKGDEHYPAYLALVQALQTAVEAGALDQARQAAQDLAQRKKACHEQYK